MAQTEEQNQEGPGTEAARADEVVRDSDDAKPESFTLTVRLLSGEEIQVTDMTPETTLAEVREKIWEMLELQEGAIVQLCLGAELLKADALAKSLKELDIVPGIQGVELVCVKQVILEPGSAVLVTGLKMTPEINGSVGTCEEWLREKGRWRVALGVLKLVPFSHLYPAGDQVKEGDEVTILGGGDKELIGHSGIVEQLLADESARVRVKMWRSVRPGNLILMAKDAKPELAARMLMNTAAEEDRDAQPAAGVDAALGREVQMDQHTNFAEAARLERQQQQCSPRAREGRSGGSGVSASTQLGRRAGSCPPAWPPSRAKEAVVPRYPGVSSSRRASSFPPEWRQRKDWSGSWLSAEIFVRLLSERRTTGPPQQTSAEAENIAEEDQSCSSSSLPPPPPQPPRPPRLPLPRPGPGQEQRDEPSDHAAQTSEAAEVEKPKRHCDAPLANLGWLWQWTSQLLAGKAESSEASRP
eukprot:TRINITY_DN8727_c0_g1_i2.p1 TRINITY_DN8727_c0_g1~~TRINITY_DN8727_c0_g1_i2.p1  ORF type:complete len:471 (-),score=128.90 TRINITY_DN8727_c0_g1_i2:76-1488(-)